MVTTLTYEQMQRHSRNFAAWLQSLPGLHMHRTRGILERYNITDQSDTQRPDDLPRGSSVGHTAKTRQNGVTKQAETELNETEPTEGTK